MKTDVGCRSSRDKYFPLNLANAYLYKRKIKNLLRITFLKTFLLIVLLGLLVGGSRKFDFFWYFFFQKFFLVTDWVLSF